MRKKRALIFVSVGVAAGLMLAIPSIISTKPIAASPPDRGIDISQLQRNASDKVMPSFDDDYQRYIGILDVLRPYPEP